MGDARHAYNRVQWRAHFVTHARKEVAFGAVGLFRHLQHHELGLGLLQAGNVGEAFQKGQTAIVLDFSYGFDDGDGLAGED